MQCPYIGITDFETASQVYEMLSVFDRAKKEFPNPIERKLMVGVMMSYKTLNDLPTKWSSVWVSKEQIQNLFTDHPLAYNTLHYADYAGNTKAEDLIRAAGYGGKNLHALQLDMVWPVVETVAEFRKEYPEIAIVLQVNAPALRQIDDNPAKFIQRLEKYAGLLDFILLDKSMGKGKGMNAAELLPFVKAIVNSKLSVSIAVAGGLGPKTLNLVRPLVTRFPFLSIDAQGQLRPSGNPLEPINWRMAVEYIRKSVAMFSR